MVHHLVRVLELTFNLSHQPDNPLRVLVPVVPVREPVVVVVVVDVVPVVSDVVPIAVLQFSRPGSTQVGLYS